MGSCGQLIEARAVIMMVARAGVAECHIRVPMVESWQGVTGVPQLAPCDPGHLTHPTDICQAEISSQSGHHLSD